MRAVLLFLIGMLSGACCAHHAPAAANAPSPATAAELSQETVALVSGDGEDIRAYCSGVWTSPNEFVTAAHCVESDTVSPEDDAVSYVGYSDVMPYGSPIQPSHFIRRLGHVALRDESHDLALVAVGDAPFHIWAPLGEPGQGQTVQTMGHPLGLWFSYSSGNIAAIRQVDFGDDKLDPAMLWVQSTAPISRGNSGGGLFDLDGNLLGICSRQNPSGHEINIYVHRNHVEGLLRKAHGR